MAKAELRKKNIIFKLWKTVNHFFPSLLDDMREINDCRKKSTYELTEILMAAIMMFVFKQGSRNAFNNERSESQFKKNYENIFNMKFPHMDTVENVLRELEENEIEKLKKLLLKQLLKKKFFRKNRLLDEYYLLVIDGTHVMNVNEGHCDHCLHRTSKKSEKKTYFHSVLEAKLVDASGFSISIGTEWIENPEGEYSKQDCELKGFVRLAERLKNDYPQLPVCIVADGLYPNQTFFNICKQNGWEYIVTFKDGNLPSVWKEVLALKGLTPKNTRENIIQKKETHIRQVYTWVNDIDYQDFKLNWYECEEEVEGEKKRFVYISSMEVDYDKVLIMTASGRMRWKIENEGFNTQKHGGYGLGHQFSRVSMEAMKNYYQCMQIAHMFNQLFELSSEVTDFLSQGKKTLKHLWSYMLGEMRHVKLRTKELRALLASRVQFRYG